MSDEAFKLVDMAHILAPDRKHLVEVRSFMVAARQQRNLAAILLCGMKGEYAELYQFHGQWD